MPVHEEGLVKGNSWRLFQGDCVEVMKEMIAVGEQFDSIVCDPPYDLVSIVKRFGKEGAAPAQFGKDGAFARASKGFLGKVWDGTGIEREEEYCGDIIMRMVSLGLED